MRKINEFVATCVTKKSYVTCDTSEKFGYSVSISNKIDHVAQIFAHTTNPLQINLVKILGYLREMLIEK